MKKIIKLFLCIVIISVVTGCSSKKLSGELNKQSQTEPSYESKVAETELTKEDNSSVSDIEQAVDKDIISLEIEPIKYFDKTLTDDIIWADEYDETNYFLVGHFEPLITEKLKSILNNAKKDEYVAVYVEYISYSALVPRCSIDISEFPEDMRQDAEILNLYNNAQTSYNSFVNELNVLLNNGESIHEAIPKISSIHSKAWNDYNNYYKFVRNYASQKMYEYLREKDALYVEYQQEYYKENGEYPSQDHLESLEWYQNAEKPLKLYTDIYNTILKAHFFSCTEANNIYFSSLGLIPYYTADDLEKYYDEYYVMAVNRDFAHVYVARVEDLFRYEEESGYNSRTTRISCAVKEMLIN